MSENEGNGNGNGENGQLRSENARRRLANANLKRDLAAARVELAALTAERDGLKSGGNKVSDAMAAELASLKAAVRLSKHKDGLKELAYGDEHGVNKSVPIDKLITLSGYKADSDEFDPKAAGKMLEGLKKSDPYLFGKSSSDESEPQRAEGPDQSHLWRAVQQRGEAGGVTTKPGSITREQSRDAAYVMNAAAERRREAAKGK